MRCDSQKSPNKPWVVPNFWLACLPACRESGSTMLCWSRKVIFILHHSPTQTSLGRVIGCAGLKKRRETGPCPPHAALLALPRDP
ncbi:hypothetical protein GQ53DRAFT_130999 [Thozetella sp. PMI_491]|nr:hypothetical protein GQ53DRAFT_130999 [Thozetella sp. PMI_491]